MFCSSNILTVFFELRNQQFWIKWNGDLRGFEKSDCVDESSLSVAKATTFRSSEILVIIARQETYISGYNRLLHNLCLTVIKKINLRFRWQPQQLRQSGIDAIAVASKQRPDKRSVFHNGVQHRVWRNTGRRLGRAAFDRYWASVMVVRPVSKIGFALLLNFRFFNQSQCWGRRATNSRTAPSPGRCTKCGRLTPPSSTVATSLWSAELYWTFFIAWKIYTKIIWKIVAKNGSASPGGGGAASLLAGRRRLQGWHKASRLGWYLRRNTGRFFPRSRGK